MSRHARIVLFVGIALGLGGPRADAQEKSWKGDQVLPTKRTKDIQFGDVVDGKQVYFPFSGRWPIEVRDDREGWLRIFDGHREGWVDKADFVLVREAPTYFHRRVQADPKDAFALQMRGEGFLLKGDLDNAIKDFDDCIRLDPTSAVVFNSRGNVWSAKDDHDKAIRDYDEAIRLDPKMSIAFYNRGGSWDSKKEYDRAIKDYDEAIRLDPKHTWAYCNRGNAWYAKKEYDRAIKDYDEAIRLDPKDADAFSSRGSARRQKREYDKSVADFNEAIRLNPKDAEAHYGRGVVGIVTGRVEAHEGFQKTIELLEWKGRRPRYAVILGHLAARRAGDGPAAQKFLKDSVGKIEETWPYPAVRYLRGEIDEAALLKLAVDDDKRTEARCYLGVDLAHKGKKEEAVAHLRWVREHGTRTFSEYIIAVEELERLERELKR